MNDFWNIISSDLIGSPHLLWLTCYDEEAPDFIAFMFKQQGYKVTIQDYNELLTTVAHEQMSLFDDPQLFLVLGQPSTTQKNKLQAISLSVHPNKKIWFVSRSKNTLNCPSATVQPARSAQLGQLIQKKNPNYSETFWNNYEFFSFGQLIHLLKCAELGIEQPDQIVDISILQVSQKSNFELFKSLHIHRGWVQNYWFQISNEQLYQLIYCLEMIHQASMFPNQSLEKFQFPPFLKTILYPKNHKVFICDHLLPIYKVLIEAVLKNDPALIKMGYTHWFLNFWTLVDSSNS